MERRGTERLLLTIPIRVIAFSSSTGSFSEDTRTVEVNRAGARIVLEHRVAPDDTLRIINLENYREADFRVLGPTRLETPEALEWGVECLEEARDIWGIEFSPPLVSQDSHSGALLECQGCGKQGLCVLSEMELAVLDSIGTLERLCDHCGELSSWMYAAVTRRPRGEPTSAKATSRSQAHMWDGKAERRVHKRLALKMPVLVRNHKGETEISKSENISKGGLAVCLAMKLAIGEIVSVVCPYAEGSEKIEQRAEVRRRAPVLAGERWLYGFRYVA